MNLEGYPYKRDPSFASFEFESEGPQGIITKVVNYLRIDTLADGTPVANLGFGDWNYAERKVSDLVVSNNADRHRVLVTVAKTVMDFTDRYGKVPVMARGSTPARTRLYQMSIAANLEEIQEYFEVLGLTPHGWQPFRKGVNFDAFVVIRK